MKISFKRDINGAFIKIDQIAFWRDHPISSCFPNLVNLSVSLISIQASSAASERLFSAAGWLDVFYNVSLFIFGSAVLIVFLPVRD